MIGEGEWPRSDVLAVELPGDQADESGRSRGRVFERSAHLAVRHPVAARFRLSELDGHRVVHGDAEDVLPAVVTSGHPVLFGELVHGGGQHVEPLVEGARLVVLVPCDLGGQLVTLPA